MSHFISVVHYSVFISLAEYGVIDCTSPSPDYHDQQSQNTTLNCNRFTHYHLLLSLNFLAPPEAQEVALSVCASVTFRISSLNLQQSLSFLLALSLKCLALSLIIHFIILYSSNRRSTKYLVWLYLRLVNIFQRSHQSNSCLHLLTQLPQLRHSPVIHSH